MRRADPANLDSRGTTGADVGWLDRWFPIVVFGAVALVLELVGVLSNKLLGLPTDEDIWRAFPKNPWLDGWCRWDAGWYVAIAGNGYGITGGVGGMQRPTHFFPVYPLLIRGVGFVTRNLFLAGIVITVCAGLASALLFHRWCKLRLDARAARTAVLVYLLYPFAFFLYGAIYSDALFLCAALAAFMLLEKDRPIWAGIVGAVATATRPVAPAIALGLVLRVLERRAVLARDERGRRRLHLRQLRPRDAGVLLSVGGMAAYSVYLWVRFRDPFHYVTTMADWEMPPGPATWFKYQVWHMLAQPHWTRLQATLLAHVVVTGVAFGLLPRVFRRFGFAYGMYALTALGIAFVSNGDIIGGMGRYILAAFPCFAAAGELLSRRSRLAGPVLAVSAAALLVLFSAFTRWQFAS